MPDSSTFKNIALRGGYVIVQVEIASEPLLDSLGREAVAKTQIIGRKIHIFIRAGLDEKEFSVTLYHEILEAMTVAVTRPPNSVIDFNEGDFERAGYEAFDRFGTATSDTLNRMLQFYGFEE